MKSVLTPRDFARAEAGLPPLDVKRRVSDHEIDSMSEELRSRVRALRAAGYQPWVDGANLFYLPEGADAEAR